MTKRRQTPLQATAAQVQQLGRDMRPHACARCGVTVRFVTVATKILRPGHIDEAEWDSHPAGGNWQRSHGTVRQRVAGQLFDERGPHRCTLPAPAPLPDYAPRDPLALVPLDLARLRAATRERSLPPAGTVPASAPVSAGQVAVEYDAGGVRTVLDLTTGKEHHRDQ